jgi:hypothetical protein
MKKEVYLTFPQRVKNKIWHIIYYVFPWLQSHLVKWHIIWHDKDRQKYHLGWLAPGRTLKELENHLHEKWGFGNHFVAWVDSGQVLSWRKLVDFDHQYHIRVFKDGELRGHYEFTPESKPLKHFDEVGEESHIREFKKFLGDFAVYEKYVSHLKPDLKTAPESEITINNEK